MRGYSPQWRLHMLSVVAALAVCVLLYRIAQVQLARHDEYLQKAKNQWHEKLTWAARRGSIYDRNGVPLAVTHRKYTLGVTPGHFLGSVEAVDYVADLLGRSPRRLRASLPRDRVYVPLSRDLHLTEDQVRKISSLRGVRLDQDQDRLYPFDAVPSQLIGRVNRAGTGSGGIELAFENRLRGEDGWLLANKDARDSTFQLVNAPGRKPVNGGDVYLTIDSRLQSIVDFELQQAIGRYGACRGAALVVEPRTGDILALSEHFAGRGDGEDAAADALYSSSCIYEPGSTFKLITDSYLLENGLVTPYKVFYGEKGKAEFDFGVFRDDHPHEWLTFKESFVYSSNICTIKAICTCDPHDLYSYILRFGFGGKTGITLPAESGGTLRQPESWSARSLPSISIGHEIGVTVFQMAMAYGALANGGCLMAPRIVLRTVGGKGSEPALHPAVRIRRVFSEETAATLKEFCREVVLKGTGKKAAVAGIPVAGKTGTSQKACERGYEPGKYVVSFIGFAPIEDPRIVCLVLLDEPKYPYYWGGESAAVVFSKVVEGIHLATDLLIEENGCRLAVRENLKKRVAVPSLLRLSHADAEELASRCKCTIESSGTEGFVYSQAPDPGTLVETGAEIRLRFRSPEDEKGRSIHVPDLVGLSIREARRLLLSCGLKSRIEGYGIVRRQSPGPGSIVDRRSSVKLVCRPPDAEKRKIKLSLARRGNG